VRIHNDESGTTDSDVPFAVTLPILIGVSYRVHHGDVFAVMLHDKSSLAIRRTYSPIAIEMNNMLTVDVIHCPTRIDGFGEYLNKRFTTQKYSLTNRDVAFYASELCITPKYLSQISQIVSNQPASTWIEYYAAFEIVRLLNDQSITLTDIADRMRFSSNSHFTRYCKRVTGMTPKEYREKR